MIMRISRLRGLSYPRDVQGADRVGPDLSKTIFSRGRHCLRRALYQGGPAHHGLDALAREGMVDLRLRFAGSVLILSPLDPFAQGPRPVVW